LPEKMKNTTLALLFLALLLLALFTPLVAGQDEGEEEEEKVKHPKKTVLERGLVSDKAITKAILREYRNYALDTDKKNFKGATLAYVTPWNNHGYDLAKIFNHKFTYVSPVWIQIKMGGEKPRLAGLHDIDHGWMTEVRGKSVTKIVPRFLFENIQSAETVFSKAQEVKQLLIDVCEKNKFDGVVLDGLSNVLSARVSGDAGRQYLTVIADALHAKNMELILVIPPYDRAFDAQDYAALVDVVDRFSLMTYDYSTVESPGPVAPLSWVTQVAQNLSPSPDNAHKLMLGINFYGFDYIPREKTGNAIVGETYVQTLQKYTPKLTWESNLAEHSFSYNDKGRTHLVFYPTLKSVYERIKLAERMGLSIAIWEIGQGLDYFYDLL